MTFHGDITAGDFFKPRSRHELVIRQGQGAEVIGMIKILQLATNSVWRRGRDSNPRYGLTYTHFPGVRLQPLGHLSNILKLTLPPNSAGAQG